MSLAGPAPFDLVRMARQLARALEKADPIPAGAYAEPARIGGPNLGVAERGYLLTLAANHLNRHTQVSDDACRNGKAWCKPRGAAYALLEVVQFEVDEHSEEHEPARALRDTLAELRSALDRAELDLQSYLESCDTRHADEVLWGRWRSHQHVITCMRPEMLYEQVKRWFATVAAVEADAVVPQFQSMTSRARFVENRRHKLRTTVEALLREDGWLLREILDVTEEVPGDEEEYKAHLENIKKRVAGVRRRGASGSEPSNDVPALEPSHSAGSSAPTASAPSDSPPPSLDAEPAGGHKGEVGQIASEGKD